MIDKVISAIFLPALLVVFFTRVTYSRTVGFILTVALILVSAYNGYLHTWWIALVDAASLTVGLYLANRMARKDAKKTASQSLED